MPMSIRSARFQIVNGLPDSPKMEAKGALRVRGPWDETPGSLGLPFRVNRLQSFPMCTGNGFSLLVCMCVSFCM